jgi:hypothetical protein
MAASFLSLVTGAGLAGSVTAATLPPIAPGEAGAHIGACMTVEGHASMFKDGQRPGIDIDLDNNGGGAPFTAFVPYPDGFEGLQALDGRNVDITGVVLMDRSKPSIQVNNPEMIVAAGTDTGKLVTCDND